MTPYVFETEENFLTITINGILNFAVTFMRKRDGRKCSWHIKGL